MHTRAVMVALGCAFGVGLVGCTPPQLLVSSQAPRGFTEKLDEYNKARQLAAAPIESIVIGLRSSIPDDLRVKLDQYRYSFSDEWAWGSHSARNASAPPKKCIAFSGGGLRSASFSFGAFLELSDQGEFGQASVVSAVSGGSYMLSYALATHYHKYSKHAPGTAPKLEDLASVPEFTKRFLDARRFLPQREAIGWGGKSIASILTNLWDNGLFGRHTNTNPAAVKYRERLCQKFHSSGSRDFKERDDCYLSEGLPIHNLGVHASNHGLPFFIFAATANVVEADVAETHSLADIVFEFTPIGFGSDGLWRYPYKRDGISSECDADPNIDTRPLCLSDAIAMSGAAMDATVVSTLVGGGVGGRKLLSALNMDLAWYIPNPLIENEVRFARQLIPFPFYKGEGDTKGVKGAHWHVSDGGHSDNLGLFSLIRRQCDQVVVVDGEQDDRYLFNSYDALKKRVYAQLGVRLAIRSIDDGLETVAKSEAKYAIGGYSQRGDYVDAGVEAYLKRRQRFASMPVSYGSVSWLPFPGRDGRLSVAYLKAAHQRLDDEKCKKIWERSCNAWGACLSNPRANDERWLNAGIEGAADLYACTVEGGNFPHESTTDLDYSALQAMAYIDLGRRVVKACGGQCFREATESFSQ